MAIRHGVRAKMRGGVRSAPTAQTRSPSRPRPGSRPPAGQTTFPNATVPKIALSNYMFTENTPAGTVLAIPSVTGGGSWTYTFESGGDMGGAVAIVANQIQATGSPVINYDGQAEELKMAQLVEAIVGAVPEEA